jgi:N-acetylmuramoyl-L-alanine amidase
MSRTVSSHKLTSNYKLSMASLMPIAAVIVATLSSAASSGAAAESRAPSASRAAPSAELSQAIPGFSTIDGAGQVETQPVPVELDGTAPAPADAPASMTAASLDLLVAAQPVSDEVSADIKCLATAVYFEARSESLSGQLAVGRVIVNRARSGRFPGSYCGVVNQPSQFSFSRAQRGNLNARMWRNAIAIAQIADQGAWQSEAEGALYFHAARVSPGWRLRRVAQIDNQIFYR